VPNYPQNPRPKSMVAKLKFNTLLNTARSGRRQGVRKGPARLVVTLTYNNSRENELRNLWAFLNSQQGSLGVFLIVLPYLSQGDGVQFTSGKTFISVASGYLVGTNNWPANTVIRKATDLIQFAGSNSVYMLAEDLVSNSTGYAQAKLCTPLLKPVLSGVNVNIENIEIQMRWVDSEMPMSFAAGNYRSLKTIKLEEEFDA
jgi:hypothetical protein